MNQLRDAMLKAKIITPEQIKEREKKDEALRKRIERDKINTLIENYEEKLPKSIKQERNIK
jgi:hypothetical protein